MSHMFSLLQNFTHFGWNFIPIVKSPISSEHLWRSYPGPALRERGRTLKALSRSGRQTQTFCFKTLTSNSPSEKNTPEHANETYVILKIKVRCNSPAIKIFQKCAEFPINHTGKS